LIRFDESGSVFRAGAVRNAMPAHRASAARIELGVLEGAVPVHLDPPPWNLRGSVKVAKPAAFSLL
jgi:hypothetical protein